MSAGIYPGQCVRRVANHLAVYVVRVGNFKKKINPISSAHKTMYIVVQG